MDSVWHLSLGLGAGAAPTSHVTLILLLKLLEPQFSRRWL